MKLEAIENYSMRSHRAISYLPPPPKQGAAAEITAIRHLRLTNFRNYAQLEVKTDAKAVVLTGVNGAGKTNLLEAVSLLAPGRGLRRAAREEVGYRAALSDASASWSVFAELMGHDGPWLAIPPGDLLSIGAWSWWQTS